MIVTSLVERKQMRHRRRCVTIAFSYISQKIMYMYHIYTHIWNTPPSSAYGMICTLWLHSSGNLFFSDNIWTISWMTCNKTFTKTSLWYLNFNQWYLINCRLPERTITGRPITTRSSMMTSSNGNICRVTGPLCGEFSGIGEFPAQRPATRGFDVFFLRLNKWLSKQWRGWWFETPSRPLWRHSNDTRLSHHNP